MKKTELLELCRKWVFQQRETPETRKITMLLHEAAKDPHKAEEAMKQLYEFLGSRKRRPAALFSWVSEYVKEGKAA